MIILAACFWGSMGIFVRRLVSGILATIEPLVAMVIGMICFSEPLTALSGAGILLILTAVVILNRRE